MAEASGKRKVSASSDADSKVGLIPIPQYATALRLDMRDPRLIPFWLIAAIASGVLILLYSPVYLARLLRVLCFDGLCRFQDFLSETRRRLKYGRTNAHNRAAQLPPEVQLQIFVLLRTRATFGSTDRLMDEWKPNYAGAFSAGRDLAAVRLVCRAWRDAATEVLFGDVTLVTASACTAFARELLARPRRSLLVRRIVFPEVSRRLSNDTVQPSVWFQRIYGSRVRRLDLKAAIDRVILQCTRATDITFFRDAAELADVPGLMQGASRLTHLSIRHLDNAGRYYTIFEAAAVARSPHLESLTLQRHRFEMSETMSAPNTLHTLRLSRCCARVGVWLSLLEHLPRLQSVFWRECRVFEASNISIAEMFAPRLDALIEVTLIDLDSPYRIAPRDLEAFSSLRRFTISAWMLPTVQTLPLSLVELVVTSPTHSIVWKAAHQRRKTLVDIAQSILRIHSVSPWLRSVQLWDTVILPYLAEWRVVAFLLRESLQPAGVEVAVNLFLAKNEEGRVRSKFRKDYQRRRLLWQDVI